MKIAVLCSGKKSSTRTSKALRRGYATLDLLVGAVLFVALVSFVVPLAVKNGRVWQDSAQYRIALDELSSQLEFLTQLDDQKRDNALSELSPSPEIVSRLPNAKLEGQLIADNDGRRIALSLSWDRIGEARPVTLVGWIAAVPPDSSKDEEQLP